MSSNDTTGISTDSIALLDRLRSLGLERRDRQQHKDLRRASVLVLLFEHENKLCTLITKRSMKLRSHPGECCFPGGRQDDEDLNDDVVTALREAREEVGLDPKAVDVLGRLESLESINHLCVSSIVGFLRFDNDNVMKQYPWKINANEVDSAFAVPLSFFLEPPESAVEVEWSGEIFLMRVYKYKDPDSKKGFAITGLTAHIAHHVASVAYPHVPKPENVPARTTHCQSEGLSISGYLGKRETSSRGRGYWTRRFFVCEDDVSAVLHQYENETHAGSKGNSANKKNRISLLDSRVTVASSSGSSEKFEFKVNALDGRVEWHLATTTHQDREMWMSTLLKRSQTVDRK